LQAFLWAWLERDYGLPPLFLHPLAALASHKKKEFAFLFFRFLENSNAPVIQEKFSLKKQKTQAEKLPLTWQSAWPEEAAYALREPSIHHAPTLWQTALRVSPWSQEIAQALLHALHELLPHYALRSEAYRWSFLPELFAERLPQAFWPSFDALRKAQGYPKSWRKSEKSVQEILRLRLWFEG
jgi:hypothetical protein